MPSYASDGYSEEFSSCSKSSSLEIKPGGKTPMSELVEMLMLAAHSSLSKKLFNVTEFWMKHFHLYNHLLLTMNHTVDWPCKV